MTLSVRLLTTAMGGVLLFGTLGAAPALASDAQGPIPPDVLQRLNSSFDELGVAREAREGLLDAYARGETWGSSSGAEPVRTESYRVGDSEYRREVFADGSVSLTSMEMPLEETRTSTRGLSGCSYLLSAGVATWSNCKVEKNNGLLTMWFRAGYWRGAGTFGTKITNTWDWDLESAGASCTKDYLGNPTGQKSRMRATCTVVGGLGTGTPFLDLDVTANSAAVNANW